MSLTPLQQIELQLRFDLIIYEVRNILDDLDFMLQELQLGDIPDFSIDVVFSPMTRKTIGK